MGLGETHWAASQHSAPKAIVVYSAGSTKTGEIQIYYCFSLSSMGKTAM